MREELERTVMLHLKLFGVKLEREFSDSLQVVKAKSQGLLEDVRLARREEEADAYAANKRLFEPVCNYPHAKAPDYTLSWLAGLRKIEFDSLCSKVKELARAAILVIEPMHGRYMKFEETWVEEIHNHYPGKETFPKIRNQKWLYSTLKTIFITEMEREAKALNLNDGDAPIISGKLRVLGICSQKEREAVEKWTMGEYNEYWLIFNGPFTLFNNNYWLSPTQ